jgi:hypothetical protein
VTDSYTPEQEADIRANPTDYEGYVFRHGPIKRSVWRNKRNRLVGPQQGIAEVFKEPSGSVPLLLPATREEQWDYLYKAEDTARTALSLSTTQQQTEWTAPDGGLPIGLVGTGDWHLGARGTDYRALDASLCLIRDTPGLYPIGMGDYIEGTTFYDKPRGSLYTGAYNSPGEQDMSLRRRAELLIGQWVAFIAGNHDEMRGRHTGETYIDKIAADLGCPHFGEGGGTIYATVGSQRYAIGVRHHFGGKAASVPRRMADEWPEWDRLHVAMLAHLHFNEVQRWSRNGGRCWGLRCGTFKLRDEYADKNGFRPEMGTPMVILLPDVEKVYAFAGDDFALGLATLSALRQQYSELSLHSSDLYGTMSSTERVA